MAKTFQLAEKVRYTKIKPKEGDNPAKLEHGNGIVVGHIIGVAGRVNYMVKDGDKAFNLEPYAINATPEEQAAYLAHHNKIQGIVEEHNKRQADDVKATNKIIDDLNAEMFGKPIV